MGWMKRTIARIDQKAIPNKGKPKTEYAPIIADFLLNVRGNTEALQLVTPAYVELLWKAAQEHALKHKDEGLPVREVEVEYLRAYAAVRFPKPGVA